MANIRENPTGDEADFHLFTVHQPSSAIPADIHPTDDPDHRPRPVTVMISAEGLVARLEQLPTRKECTGPCCLA
jgi:hypothetical protein